MPLVEIFLNGCNNPFVVLFYKQLEIHTFEKKIFQEVYFGGDNQYCYKRTLWLISDSFQRQHGTQAS